MFRDQVLKDRVQRSIVKFCKESTEVIEPFQGRFIRLSNALMNIEEVEEAASVFSSGLHVRPPDRDIYPNEVHGLLYEGIKSHTLCVPNYHRASVASASNWHSTRLCLSSGYRSEGQLTLFNIITATSGMTYWHEMAVTIPTYVTMFLQILRSGRQCSC